eukprot:7390788-Prymnesium_polylepis.1
MATGPPAAAKVVGGASADLKPQLTRSTLAPSKQPPLGDPLAASRAEQSAPHAAAEPTATHAVT